MVADLAPVHLFRNDELPDSAAADRALRRGGERRRGRGAGCSSARGRSRALIDRARARVRRRIEATFHPDAAALGRALVLGETDLDPDGRRGLPAERALAPARGLGDAPGDRGRRLRGGAARAPGARRAARGADRRRPRRRRVRHPGGVALRRLRGRERLGDPRRGDAQRGDARRAPSAGARPPVAHLRVLAAGARARSIRSSPATSPSRSPRARPRASSSSSSRSRGAIVRGPGARCKKLLAPVATTLAAMLGCTPLLAVLAPTLPLLGIAANLLAAPLGELAALPICLGHAVLWWAPPVERGAALLGSGALLGVRAVARWSTAAGAVIAGAAADGARSSRRSP